MPARAGYQTLDVYVPKTVKFRGISARWWCGCRVRVGRGTMDYCPALVLMLYGFVVASINYVDPMWGRTRRSS